MERETYRIGLALSGGGVRGAVHLGILKVLTENGIYPDIVSGTSAGSIAGALYATGVDLNEFVEKFQSINPLNLLDPTMSIVYLILLVYYRCTHRPMVKWAMPQGLFKGEKIEKFLDDTLGGKSFNNLKIPMSAVSVDIDTGETVIFCPRKNVPRRKIHNTVFVTDQSVAAGVRASISLPAVFIPKKIKGRKLVDGGIKNNIPVDILRQQGAKKIIAVDLGVSQNRAKADSIVEIIMASVDIMGDELSYFIRREHPGYYIYPDIQGVGYRDIDRLPEIVKFGEKVANRELPNIVKYLSL